MQDEPLHMFRLLCPRKVLGLNLAVMDILYLLLLPQCIYTENFWYNGVNSHTNQTDTGSNSSQPQIHTEPWMETLFSMFNLLGCPLFLTCMCLERYLAVAQPVLYLRARRWEIRAACCALVWAVTMAGAFIVGKRTPGRAMVSSIKQTRRYV